MMKNEGLSLPIISDSQIIIDSYLLQMFRGCETSFKLRGIEKLVHRKMSAAPAFGIAFHEGAAAFRQLESAGDFDYQSMLTKSLSKLAEAWGKHMPIELKSEVAQDDRYSILNGARIFQGWTQKYAPLHYKYHGIEIPFSFLLGKVGALEVIYTGIIDAVLEASSTIYVDDIKTTAMNISQDKLDSYRMVQAMLGYLTAAQALISREIHGTMIHLIWVQKEPKSKAGKPLDEYFHTPTFTFSEEQLEEWRENTLMTCERIHKAWSRGKWEMNFGSTCAAFRNCQYFSICASTPGVRHMIKANDFQQQLWTPLEEERSQKVEE